jgi:hypothetical protein
MLAGMALDCWAQGWPVPAWAPVVLVGAMVAISNLYFAEKRRHGDELRVAREAVEEMARIAERERIGRDLHDLLGHTLSVIVLKSELASKLADRDITRAVAEIRDVERISRETLSEVRKAVQGYRIGKGLHAEFGNAERVSRLPAWAARRSPAIPRQNQERVLAFALREVNRLVRHRMPGTAGSRSGRKTARRAGSQGRWPGTRRRESASGMRERPQQVAGTPGGRLRGRRDCGCGRCSVPGPEAPRHDPVLIAEDQAMVLGALAALIDIEQDLGCRPNTLGDAALGPPLAEGRRRHRHRDAWPVWDGTWRPRRVAARHRANHHFHTSRGPDICAGRRSGRERYLLRDAPLHRLADAIRRVHAGGRAVDPELCRRSMVWGGPLPDQGTTGADRPPGRPARNRRGSDLRRNGQNYLSEAINKIGAKKRVDAARIAREGWL